MQVTIGRGNNRIVVEGPSVAFAKMSQAGKILHERFAEGVKAKILRPQTFRGFS